MPSEIVLPSGEKIEQDLFEIIPHNEAVVNQYIGKIRSGKTYTGTRDAIKDLENGNVVYTSWKINWQGYDERQDRWQLWKAAHGFKRTPFKVFPKENYHYLPFTSRDKKIYLPYDNFIEKLFSLTDCIVYLDEGQGPLNSYEKTKISQEKQDGILFTGHFNRTINILSQRAVQIHPMLRANVSRWYKIEKKEGWFSIHFKKSEYQEANDNNLPDMRGEPESIEEYNFDKKIGEMYDSKYMRGDTPPSQKNFAEIHHITKEEAKKLLKK